MTFFHSLMSAPQGRSRATGFTLLELLLVLVVVSIAFGIAVPLFMRSFQSHRLRTAGRTMIMTVKYARNMSVLKQRAYALRFEFEAGRIDLVSGDSTLSGFSRSIDGVALDWVKRDGHEAVREGTCEIEFFSNGTCRPFALCIRDASGNAVEMHVDAVGDVRSLDLKSVK